MMNVGVLGTGYYLPTQILTNRDLEKMVDTSDEWIKTRTGIEERRIATDDVDTSDMAFEAAKQALAAANVSAEEIDLILVATVTPDTSFPSVSCVIQDKLGASNAAAMDVGAACAGFIYAMTTAEQFIKTKVYQKILVIGADKLSKITEWTDRNTCVLLGDGAGVVVMGEVSESRGILSFELGANGAGGPYLKEDKKGQPAPLDRKSTRLNSSHVAISYAVFCLKKKKNLIL